MTATATERRSVLDERLIGYHGHGLTDVLEMLDYLRDEGDTVIAGGSLSIGLGNALSDVDMVLVGPSTKTSAVPLQHWVGGLRIDAWTRSTADVDALFAEAEAALVSPAPLLRVFGNTEQEQQLKLLHRIAFGVLVEGDAVRPSTSRDPQTVAADLLTREYAERLRESACVARLALDAGRVRSAVYSAREALEEALHALIHARGMPFTGDKWLQEQLVGRPELAGLHAAFLDLPTGPAGDPAHFVEEALAAAEQLVGLSLAATELTQGLRWKVSGELQLLPLSGEHVLVGPESGSAWTLDAAEAEAWTALATTLDGGLVDHPAGSPAEAALCVRLHEQGVLTPTWDRGVPLTLLTLDQESVR